MLLAGAASGQSLPQSTDRQPLTREAAIRAALTNGPRLGIARADSGAARAELLAARALQNPSLAATYTKDVPQYHLQLEIPVDYPWVRSRRIRSAREMQTAAATRFVFDRAVVALDADTTYTRALAARARAELSRRNTGDADTLVRFARARRDVGDASDLDVRLAEVSAGQQANIAAGDSLAYLAAVLDLQAVMGLPPDQVAVVPTDSLAPPPDASSGSSLQPVPLRVAAAERSVVAARLALRAQRGGVFSSPSLLAGFDTHDPDSGDNSLLPVIGFTIPLPLLDRNRGGIALASAQLRRAESELTLARVTSATEIDRARRERDLAIARIARDRLLLASANQVAAMSLTAYREGAAPIASVLEAQRNARDVLAQYIDDLAAAWIATAMLRVVTMSSTTAP
jgi:cobalt-zinc-cadmium efflux system outer membrane protein